MKEEIKISSECIFKGHVITVEKDVVQVESGNEASREVVRHPGAAAIVLQLDNGDIVLEKQYRYALGDFLIEIPAGKLDPKEEPLHCAQRELKEETGYTAKNWIYLGKTATSAGFCDEVIHLYFASEATKGEVELDEDEFVDTFTVSKEKFMEMTKSGEIWDGKTVTAMFLAMPYLK